MFEIEINGFSGPLDLLCHLIDQDEIEASQISVSEVVSIYTAYLAQNSELAITNIAEFISQAAHLVRQKTFALLPRYPQPSEDDFDEIVVSEEDSIGDIIERYRPYREAARLLENLKIKAERRRFRKSELLDPFFDLGDLYSLSIQWLELLNRKRRTNFELPEEDEWEDDTLPAQIPDEIQVENRMERIMERLEAVKRLSLRSFLKEDPGRSALVVSLLALLELSRRNRVTLTQEELFGDVSIRIREIS